jgi:hypothetical protein
MANLAAQWQKDTGDFDADAAAAQAAANAGGRDSEAPPPQTPSLFARAFQRYSVQEEGNETMERYHRQLHAASTGGAEEANLGQVAGFASTRTGVSEDELALSKQTISKEAEGRMAHMYAGPVAPPAAPAGNAKSAAEREAFLNRAGANPYDAYHGEEGTSTTTKAANFVRYPEFDGKTRTEGGERQSPEMQTFLSHLKLQAGVMGPLAPMLRHQLDPGDNTYAAIRSANMPLVGDPRVSKLALAMSDWDWADKRMSVNTACMYHQGPNIVAITLFAMLYFAYHYQIEHEWFDYYEEYLGLDLRFAEQELEKLFVLLLTAAFIRLVLVHPTAVAAVVGIRYYRILRGLPLGPP